MISKELLTAIRTDVHKVLNIDLDYIQEDNKIGYFLDNRQWYFINIYEIANTCKIWAFYQGYELLSGTISEDNGDMIFECSIYNKNADGADTYFITEFEALNEPEVVFKACEWILEQNKEI
jgi:hypothetical protein